MNDVFIQLNQIWKLMMLNWIIANPNFKVFYLKHFTNFFLQGTTNYYLTKTHNLADKGFNIKKNGKNIAILAEIIILAWNWKMLKFQDI